MTIEDGDRELYLAASARFPDDKHKTEVRGGAPITYVEGETVISHLNETFVWGWGFKILDWGINEDADEVYVRGRLTVQQRVTTRSTTIDAEGKVVSSTITEQIVPVHREQCGSQKLKRGRSTGKVMDIGFDMKGATTDCIKKCASLFGVALYLWNKEELAILHARLEDDRTNSSAQDGEQDGGQGAGRRRPARPNFNRANRSALPAPSDEEPPDRPDEPGQSIPFIVNGLTMPSGFVMPFELDDRGRQETECRAGGCSTIVDPRHSYKVGADEKPGAYVLERAQAEAGCPLCVPHMAQWFRAKQAASQAS